MQLLAETDGVEMTFNDDRAVTPRWHLQGNGDHQTGDGDRALLEEPKEEAAPF